MWVLSVWVLWASVFKRLAVPIALLLQHGSGYAQQLTFRQSQWINQGQMDLNAWGGKPSFSNRSILAISDQRIQANWRLPTYHVDLTLSMEDAKLLTLRSSAASLSLAANEEARKQPIQETPVLLAFDVAHWRSIGMNWTTTDQAGVWRLSVSPQVVQLLEARGAQAQARWAVDDAGQQRLMANTFQYQGSPWGWAPHMRSADWGSGVTLDLHLQHQGPFFSWFISGRNVFSSIQVSGLNQRQRTYNASAKAGQLTFQALPTVQGRYGSVDQNLALPTYMTAQGRWARPGLSSALMMGSIWTQGGSAQWLGFEHAIGPDWRVIMTTGGAGQKNLGLVKGNLAQPGWHLSLGIQGSVRWGWQASEVTLSYQLP